MYKIMIIGKKDSNGALYKFLKNTDGDDYSTDSLQELDAKVEELLNTYGKNSFIVVQILEYEIDADIYQSV